MVYLSGAGLPRLSWKKGLYMDVVVVHDFIIKFQNNICTSKVISAGLSTQYRENHVSSNAMILLVGCQEGDAASENVFDLSPKGSLPKQMEE